MHENLKAGTLLHPRKAGYNVDQIDVSAGMRAFYDLGYTDQFSAMVIEHSLMLWQRGEEDSAEKKAIDSTFHGISLTSWRVILATAMGNAKANCAKCTKHIEVDGQGFWKDSTNDPYYCPSSIDFKHSPRED